MMHEREALVLAVQTGDRPLEAQLCAGLAWGLFVTGKGVDEDLIERAIRGEQPAGLSVELRPTVAIAHLLHLSDDLDGARSLYEKEYEQATGAGVETGLPLLLWGLAETEAYSGDWERAEELAEEGHQVAEDAGNPAGVCLMAATRALVHAYRGRLDASGRDSGRALALAEALEVPFFALVAVQSSGVCHLSAGDPGAAHEILDPFAEKCAPTAFWSLRSCAFFQTRSKPSSGSAGPTQRPSCSTPSRGDRTTSGEDGGSRSPAAAGGCCSPRRATSTEPRQHTRRR